jgi:O-acetyl-ADP-ribose deacetylase (regulator of RNase III)
MDRASAVSRLVEMLLDATPSLKNQAGQFGGSYEAQRLLLRGLMNMCQVRRRPPEEFFPLQDELLSAERDDRPTVTFGDLEPSVVSPRVRVYRGDILNIKADAIVNAANSSLLGCFIAGHNCIDNCIHSAAGLELRFECDEIMKKAGHPAPVGCAVVTKGWNLKSPHVIHTVGPNISGPLTSRDHDDLALCYTNCLKAARENGFKSIAFPCISTGAFSFPHTEAASVAVPAVLSDMKANHDDPDVIFVVFEKVDAEAYDYVMKDLREKQLHPEKAKHEARLSALWSVKRPGEDGWKQL